MRQIERTLCRRGWRGNRRAVGGILAVLSLVFFALTVTWQMEDSVAATMEEARLERYGAWECAAPGAALADWQDNRFIAEAGRVRSVGAIEDEAFTGTTAAVGVWDETAWSLGRLTLLRGRLPEADGEIAVEASTLYALGYEGELGETLTLTIAPFREDGAGEYTENAEAGRTLSFTLCGILPDYQEEWEICGDVLFPTALISTSQADVLSAGSVAVSCVLLKTEDGYDLLARELSESGEEAEDLIFNENAYPELTSTSLEETLRTLRRALLGVSVGILALFVLSYVRSRRETWRTLSLLGADHWQLRRMLWWECLTFWGISAAAGTAAGVLLFRLAVPLFSRTMEEEFVYSLSFVHLATGVAVGSLSVWLAWLLPMLFLGRWLETDGKRTETSSQRKVRRGGFSPTRTPLITAGWLLGQDVRSHPLRRGLQFLLAVLALGIVVQGLNLSVSAGASLRYWQAESRAQYTYDRSLEETALRRNEWPLGGLMETRMEGLEDLLGVESVEAFIWSQAGELFRADLSDHAGEYYQKNASRLSVLKENQEAALAEHRGDDEEENATSPLTADDVPIGVLGLSGEDALERYLENLDAGDVDEEALFRGEEAILVVPDAFTTPDAAALSHAAEDSDTLYYQASLNEEHQAFYRQAGYAEVREDTFSVGDTITLCCLDENGEESGKKTVRIAGIIYSMDANDCYIPAVGEPYTVITGEDFFRSFSYWEEEIRYNYVNVYTSWEAEYAATRQQVTAALKTSVSGGGFTDRAAQRAEAREEMLRVLGTYALAGGFVVLILLILLVQSLRQDLEQQRERIRLWQELGLSDAVLLGRYRLESLADSLGSILISGLYLFGSWLYAWREQGADALDYVLGNVVPYYPWALHVLAAVLCLFLFLGIYYWPVRRFILAGEGHSAARRRKRRKSCTESET